MCLNQNSLVARKGPIKYRQATCPLYRISCNKLTIHVHHSLKLQYTKVHVSNDQNNIIIISYHRQQNKPSGYQLLRGNTVADRNAILQNNTLTCRHCVLFNKTSQRKENHLLICSNGLLYHVIILDQRLNIQLVNGYVSKFIYTLQMKQYLIILIILKRLYIRNCGIILFPGLTYFFLFIIRLHSSLMSMAQLFD